MVTLIIRLSPDALLSARISPDAYAQCTHKFLMRMLSARMKQKFKKNFIDTNKWSQKLPQQKTL
jgi:hypothetical protein